MQRGRSQRPMGCRGGMTGTSASDSCGVSAEMWHLGNFCSPGVGAGVGGGRQGDVGVPWGSRDVQAVPVLVQAPWSPGPCWCR